MVSLYQQDEGIELYDLITYCVLSLEVVMHYTVLFTLISLMPGKFTLSNEDITVTWEG